jgi:antibiotic biosynthesis monooxygenase (ABM) superfamily enzyme
MIKKADIARMKTIVVIMMVILIVIAGIYLFLSPSFNCWPKNISIIFAIFIIEYGFFRLVNTDYKLMKGRYTI